METSPSVQIPRSIWAEMQAEAGLRAPEEACGLLAGRDNRIEKHYAIPNDLHSPTRFRMEAQSQVRAFVDMDQLNLELLAIWHSHPSGPPFPSPTDIADFAYPGTLYLIWVPDYLESNGVIKSWGARGFRIEGRLVCESILKVE
jgi:proteasome lid subunit RPN8/RPN11